LLRFDGSLSIGSILNFLDFLAKIYAKQKWRGSPIDLACAIERGTQMQNFSTNNENVNWLTVYAALPRAEEEGFVLANSAGRFGVTPHRD
jgi:hypothetical protein